MTCHDVCNILRTLLSEALFKQITVIPGDICAGDDADCGEGSLLCIVAFPHHHQIFIYNEVGWKLQAQWIDWNDEEQRNVLLTRRLCDVGLYELLKQFLPTLCAVLEQNIE